MKYSKQIVIEGLERSIKKIKKEISFTTAAKKKKKKPRNRLKKEEKKI